MYLCGRADQLREMVEAVVRHRKAAAATTPDDRLLITRVDLSGPPPRPRWVSRIERAAKDGVLESLYASIREEGWRAFAEGGREAMSALAERACGDDPQLMNIVDHRWDRIGTEARGYWIACSNRSNCRMVERSETHRNAPLRGHDGFASRQPTLPRLSAAKSVSTSAVRRFAADLSQSGICGAVSPGSPCQKQVM